MHDNAWQYIWPPKTGSTNFLDLAPIFQFQFIAHYLQKM